MDTPLVERRKKHRCRLDQRTQRFLKYWPLLLVPYYATIAIFPDPVFLGNYLGRIYIFAAYTVALLAPFCTIFWKKIFLRNILVSVLLARSVSIIIVALFAPPIDIPFSIICRISASAIISVLFFLITTVEIPYLKVMRHDTKP